MSINSANNTSLSIKKSEKCETSIDDYARDIGKIWTQDKKRPPLLHWLYVINHATIVCEEVRKECWDKVAEHLAEVMVWWLSFSYRITIFPEANLRDAAEITTFIETTPSNIVWFKFPGLCPVCFSRWVKTKRDFKNLVDTNLPTLISNNLEKISTYFRTNQRCTCLAAKEEIENRTKDFKIFTKKCVREYARQTLDRKPDSLFKMEKMLNTIYSNNISVLTVEEISFHLLEEIGEVSSAITELFMHSQTDLTDLVLFQKERKQSLINFSEELADVFSWSVSLLGKISRFLCCAADFVQRFRPFNGVDILVEAALKPSQTIVDLIWKVYETDSVLKCEKCKERPCNPRHPEHKDKGGQLLGKLPQNVYDVIKTNSNPLS